MKRHLAENIYDYLPWIFKYSTDRKIRIFASLLFNCTVYDKTTWPRPSAILLASGYRTYSNFEPCKPACILAKHKQHIMDIVINYFLFKILAILFFCMLHSIQNIQCQCIQIVVKKNCTILRTFEIDAGQRSTVNDLLLVTSEFHVS